MAVEGPLTTNEEKKQFWLDKIRFGQELEDLCKNSTFQKVLEGMSEMAYNYLRIIDNPNTPPEELQEALIQRRSIKAFQRSIVINMLEGEQAEKELKKFLDWEKDRDTKSNKKEM